MTELDQKQLGKTLRNIADPAAMERRTMNTKDISTARDPDLRASLAALRRASELARKTAIQTGTDLVIVKDGKRLRIPAATLAEQSKSALQP